MSTQLGVVSVEDGEPGQLAAFRTDARLRLWGAGACACGSIAMTAVGYQRALSPVLAGPVAAALLLWSMYLLATFAGRRSVRYTLTAQRLDREAGGKLSLDMIFLNISLDCLTANAPIPAKFMAILLKGN